jgi:urate oxidase
MPAKLAGNSYGKSDVRVTKVIRNGDHHQLMEFSVDVQLNGEFSESYTHGDNSSIIATDSMKNTIYVLAKERHFTTAEEFAFLLAEHFLKTYRQTGLVTTSIRQTNWARIVVEEKPHDHAFICGGPDLWTATALVHRDGLSQISGGVTDLMILKTTRSAFKDFVSDRYRTLKDADDRIFATKLTASWSFYSCKADFVSVRQRIQSTMLNVFATTMSYAVQQTMYQMGEAAIAAVPEISQISLRMPNKHRIPVNLQPFGLVNENEVFVWTDEPFGEIFATVERES